MRLDPANLPPNIAAAHGREPWLKHHPDCPCPTCLRQKAGQPARTEPASVPIVAKPAKAATKAPGKRRKAMNQTESAFAAILEAKKLAGEIVSYEYEGMTLRWGKLDNIQYTPDFFVIEYMHGSALSPTPCVRIVFIETKGSHIWPQAMQKFKQARNEWPLFRFEMWQRKKGQWTQLL